MIARPLIQLNRFHHIVVYPELEPFLFRGQVVLCGHKQDRDCPIHLPDCPRKLEPVNLRHHDVGDDQLIEIIVHLIISFPYVQTSFHLKSAVT